MNLKLSNDQIASQTSSSNVMLTEHYTLGTSDTHDTGKSTTDYVAIITGFYLVGEHDISSAKAYMTEGTNNTWVIKANTNDSSDRKWFECDVLFIPSAYFEVIGDTAQMKIEHCFMGSKSEYNTNVSTDDWVAVLAGFDIVGRRDISALEAYLRQNPEDGNWWVQAGAGVDSDSVECYVLFIDKDFFGDGNQMKLTHYVLSDPSLNTNESTQDWQAVLAGFYIVGNRDVNAVEAYLHTKDDAKWWLQVGAGSDTKFNECDVLFIEPSLFGN